MTYRIGVLTKGIHRPHIPQHGSTTLYKLIERMSTNDVGSDARLSGRLARIDVSCDGPGDTSAMPQYLIIPVSTWERRKFN